MNQNNKYLEEYRRLESVLRMNGFDTVKAYEDSLESEPDKQGKLRICRLMRNFMEHEDTAFIDATDRMIKFITDEAITIDAAEVPVKKKMNTIKNSVKDTDTLASAMVYIGKNKLPMAPVFDKNGYAVGILKTENVLKFAGGKDYTKTKKVNAVMTKYKFGFVRDDVPMRKVMPFIKEKDRIYLVITEDKKVIGWII